jgi:uncharacterized membrane protein YccC
MRARVQRWDPDLATIHKAIRAAVLMPLVFVLAKVVIGNLQMALFASFGSFAVLVLTDVSGPPRSRLVAFSALAVLGSVLVVLGTLCARHALVAALAMAAVAFVVLLAGAVSPLAAMTTTAALLTFILPVSIPAPGAVLSARLAGWWLAVAVGVPAQMLIWPPEWHDRLRAALTEALGAVRRLVRQRTPTLPADLDDGIDRGPVAAAGSDQTGRGQIDRAVDAARTAVSELQLQFESTPFRPTESAGRGLALAKLVDDLEWLRAAASSDPDRDAVDEGFCPGSTQRVWAAADELMAAIPDLLVASAGRPGPDHPAARRVVTALAALRHDRRRLSAQVRQAFTELALRRDPAAPSSPELIGSVGPSLNARRVANASELLGRHSLLAAGLVPGLVSGQDADAAGQMDASGPGDAEPADPMNEGDGIHSSDLPTSVRLSPAAQLQSFASVRSVWFRAATRGAVALAVAVAVAKGIPVQHGFWVVLGTLSVLRSNAVGTGSRALRALGGTVAGFAIAFVVLAVIGPQSVLLWAVLPLAVFMATVAPAVISFMAGQAAFTVVVVVLFNLLEPGGWHVGLIRVQDVAIGCAISVVVGLVCWPRGASGTFGQALGDALSAGSSYLLAAVEVTTGVAADRNLHDAHLAALTADRRLDDAFRLFLTERSVQRVGLDVANRLVAGATRIRLAAFSLATLPARTGSEGVDEGIDENVERAGLAAASAAAPGAGDGDALDQAGHALCRAAAGAHQWYVEATAALASTGGQLADAPPELPDVADLVRAALDEARRFDDPEGVGRALALIWAERHLLRQTQLQRDLAAQAEHLLSLRRPWWA